MHSACTRGSAGEDFTSLGDESAELGHVLVVDVVDFIYAEGTYFAARASELGVSGARSSLKCHDSSELFFAERIVVTVVSGLSRGSGVGVVSAGLLVAAAGSVSAFQGGNVVGAYLNDAASLTVLGEMPLPTASRSISSERTSLPPASRAQIRSFASCVLDSRFFSIPFNSSSAVIS